MGFRLYKPIRSVTFLFISFCLHTSFAQIPTPALIQVGKITTVATTAHPDQSYALFLPTNYTPDKSWPTVFCFDPRARGQVAIERFAEAAEKLGYIVVCSNNSRNGLNWTTIADIFTTFWDDVHNRFHVDEKRTFAAGFSGGSRLATTFATRCRGCLAGVIGCGAGFPGDIQPDPKTPFAYYGIVGVDDFNFGEMFELERRLSKFSAPYNFETFAGAHEWPPKESIERGLAWLSLQSIKSGASQPNKSFVEEQFNTRLNLAQGLLSNARFLDANRAFNSIVRDFQGMVDLGSTSRKADELSKSSEVKKESSTEEDLYRRQLREAGEIRMLWMKPAEPDSPQTGRPEASTKLSQLRKTKEQPTDSKDRRLARRVLTHLTIESFETAQASLRKADYITALANYQLVKEIDPKNANVHYEIARVFALKGQKNNAIQSLQEAVSLGFKDVTRLKADEAFSTLAAEPKFQMLVTALAADLSFK
jgi:dienelactone hydrolase